MREKGKGLTTDDKQVLDGLSTSLLDELTSRRGTSTGSDQVVHHQHVRALRQRALLDLERVLSVLERVRHLVARSGKLLRLSDGDKGASQSESEWGSRKVCNPTYLEPFSYSLFDNDKRK